MLFLRSRAEMLFEFRTGSDRNLRDNLRQAGSFQRTVQIRRSSASAGIPIKPMAGFAGVSTKTSAGLPR